MFDLELILMAAEEFGFEIVSSGESRVDVRVGPSHILCFENLVEEKDTIIFFENGWHSHGDIMGEVIGCDIEDVPDEILSALHKGKTILVKETFPDGRILLGLEDTNWLSGDSIKNSIETMVRGMSIEYSRVV